MKDLQAASIRHQQILGVNFFLGTAQQAIAEMCAHGGLMVAPSGPGLEDLERARAYRESLFNADLVITDSGFMVLLWNVLHRNKVPRVSGLEYMREFVSNPQLARSGSTFWVMASAASAERNLRWLTDQGFEIDKRDVYIAPKYDGRVADATLVQLLRERRPAHVVITVGGGVQEPLGHYLKTNLDYRPGIHCIGAAIAFLTGDQTAIPKWADYLYLGWLFRILSKPRVYFPRYWKAARLASVLWRYRSEAPPLSALAD